MIPNLKQKANNEKYFKSIRYFSHSLKGEKRREFILLVSKYNIFLSAQCIMSAEKDEYLESELKIKSQQLAKNFNSAEQSANGFLALAEFESYEIISKLLVEVSKPTNIHYRVFLKIFENNNQEMFISFLGIIIQLEKMGLLNYAIGAYNGRIIVNNNNKEILRKLFEFLFSKGLFGMSRIIIEKFDLFKELPFILNKQQEEIIELLLGSKKREANASKLAYELCNYFKMFNTYSPELFIERALKNKRISNKGLILSIEIAVKNNIRDNKYINQKIENLLASKKKSRNKLNQLKRKGLFKYLENNESLFQKVTDFLTVKKKIINIGENLEKQTILNNNQSVKNEIELFINNKNDNVDSLIQYLLMNYNTSLMEISHIFRNYEFTGNIKYITDYGYYVKPIDFKSSRLLFLHKQQVDIDNPSNSYVNKELINFRVIGINQQNYRLNISCLEKFNPNNKSR